MIGTTLLYTYDQWSKTDSIAQRPAQTEPTKTHGGDGIASFSL